MRTDREWRNKLKPKVTVFTEDDEWRKKIAMEILNEYWKSLEPAIEALLKREREEKFINGYRTGNSIQLEWEQIKEEQRQGLLTALGD